MNKLYEYINFCKFKVEEEPNWNAELYIKITYKKRTGLDLKRSLESVFGEEEIDGKPNPEYFKAKEFYNENGKYLYYGNLYFESPNLLKAIREKMSISFKFKKPF